jgi:hypothetical protein
MKSTAWGVVCNSVIQFNSARKTLAWNGPHELKVIAIAVVIIPAEFLLDQRNEHATLQ